SPSSCCGFWSTSTDPFTSTTGRSKSSDVPETDQPARAAAMDEVRPGVARHRLVVWLSSPAQLGPRLAKGFAGPDGVTPNLAGTDRRAGLFRGAVVFLHPRPTADRSRGVP